MNDNNTCYLCCSVCGERFMLFDVQLFAEKFGGSSWPSLVVLPETCDMVQNVNTLKGFLTKHLHLGERLENDLGTGFYLEHTCMLDVYNDVSRARAFYTLPDSERWFEDDGRN